MHARKLPGRWSHRLNSDCALDKYHAPQWLGERAPRRFHVMAKPAGSACNLDCTYCFYLSKQALPGGPGGGHMSDEILERFIRDYIQSVTVDQVVFSWQGGEPTLLGLGFFEKVVALQNRHAKPGQRIENDLQTNGTLLDDDWARFLKKHHFLVGLSIDGPREIHDHYRVTKRGEPTFDAVCRAAHMLRKFGVRYNTLTCVHRYNASRPLDVYRFLRRELDSTYLQFIPVVETERSSAIARRHGVLAEPGAFRLREIRSLAGVLQAVPLPQRLLGRVSEESPVANARWRAGPQLSLPGPEALFRACSTYCPENGGATSRGIGQDLTFPTRSRMHAGHVARLGHSRGPTVRAACPIRPVGTVLGRSDHDGDVIQQPTRAKARSASRRKNRRESWLCHS